MPQAELTLDQMLADVIVQMVMRRDRVTEPEIRELMASLARQREGSKFEHLPRILAQAA